MTLIVVFPLRGYQIKPTNNQKISQSQEAQEGPLSPMQTYMRQGQVEIAVAHILTYLPTNIHNNTHANIQRHGQVEIAVAHILTYLSTHTHTHTHTHVQTYSGTVKSRSLSRARSTRSSTHSPSRASQRDGGMSLYRYSVAESVTVFRLTGIDGVLCSTRMLLSFCLFAAPYFRPSIKSGRDKEVCVICTHAD